MNKNVSRTIQNLNEIAELTRNIQSDCKELFECESVSDEVVDLYFYQKYGYDYFKIKQMIEINNSVANYPDFTDELNDLMQYNNQLIQFKIDKKKQQIEKLNLELDNLKGQLR